MSNTKEYEIKESLLVTYRVLNSIFFEFQAEYPNEIATQMKSLLKDLQLYLEDYNNVPSNAAIESSLYRKITFFPDN